MLKRSFIQLVLAKFKEFIREPGIIFWSLIFPIAMAWVLGVAFSEKPTVKYQIGLIQSQKNPNYDLRNFLSHDTINGLSNNQPFIERTFTNEKIGTITCRFIITSPDSAIMMIKRGQIAMYIVESTDSIFYFFDPVNENAKYQYLLISGMIEEGELPSFNAVKPMTLSGTRYIDFLVPGLMALGLINSILWGISYGLIEMRMKKLLRRLVATPMKRSFFLISHFTARFILTSIETLILYLFAHFYFGFELKGSFLALLFLIISGNLAFMGIATLVSSRVSNTRIGTGIINAITMPMMVVSGIFFSYHNFPEVIIPFIKYLPLTILADGMRSIFLEGAGFVDTWFSMLILIFLGFITFAGALKIFKWY